jgi:aspartate aminotransferase
MNAVRNFVKVLEYSHSAGFESYRSKLAHSTQIKDYPSMLKILLLQQVDQKLYFSTMDPGDEIIIPEPFYANYNGFSAASELM